MRRGLRLGALPLAVLPAVIPGGLGAQDPPPPPLPLEEFTIPPYTERALSNGARVLVVPHHEMPLVTVDLVLPGGRTADPLDRVGLADLTAGLLLRGAGSRTGAAIEAALDHRGAELDASAGADWTTLSARAVTPHLPDVLELLADVVLHPTFPAEELERVRAERVAELEAALAEPATLADRSFTRAVYGGHPYGRLPTVETLEAVDRASVVDFHRTWYRPGRALFVVAGDVDPDRAVELLERTFGAWAPGAPEPVAHGLPPLRHAPEVVLVHRPGADRAVLRIGHTVGRGSEGDEDDWTALSALSRILGGGPFARLSRVLRRRDPAAAALVEVQRRLDRGFLRVSAETRADGVGPALESLYAQLLRVRDEPVSIAELRHARDALGGAFLLGVETSRQLASHLATARLLGLPESTLARRRARVASLDPGDLREVAAEWIQPDELVFVVVGDARRVHAQLTGFGNVTVVDGAGDPVDMAAFLPRGRSEPLDASILRPITVEYRVTFQDRSVGTVVRTLEAGESPETMTFRGTARIGPDTVAQSVTFTVPGFEVVAAAFRIGSAGDRVSMDVRVRDGRVEGSVRGPGPRAERLERALPRGAVMGDMEELVLWIAELEEGKELQVPGVQPEAGTAHNVLYRVTGAEDVTVPAGTVPAWRVEVSGLEPQTVWVRREAPHVPLRIEPAVRPVVLELTSPLAPAG